MLMVLTGQMVMVQALMLLVVAGADMKVRLQQVVLVGVHQAAQAVAAKAMTMMVGNALVAVAVAVVVARLLLVAAVAGRL